jgi:hypothetical protein
VRDERVVRLAERRLHSLLITDDRLLAARLGRLDLRLDQSGGEDWLCQRGRQRPHGGRSGKQIAELRRLGAVGAG